MTPTAQAVATVTPRQIARIRWALRGEIVKARADIITQRAYESRAS
jgi:hypothetical protein